MSDVHIVWRQQLLSADCQVSQLFASGTKSRRNRIAMNKNCISSDTSKCKGRLCTFHFPFYLPRTLVSHKMLKEMAEMGFQAMLNFMPNKSALSDLSMRINKDTAMW